MNDDDVKTAIDLLNRHYDAFYEVVEMARKTSHPVPMDTRGWSQIIVSVLTGIPGLAKKGADLEDGSDVKAANTWEAIDTPRFNEVIKAGTKAEAANSIASLEGMPHLFFVLWDQKQSGEHRCRIWVVRTQDDVVFRTMCEAWYKDRMDGKITSNNFQLHPPRGKDTNVFRNTYGNLQYPLLFAAERRNGGYVITTRDDDALDAGECSKGDPTGVLNILFGDENS